ncbi:MAG: DUF4926 domain-containing protein [Aquificales bacterium]|nr:DUF4926 domain-containing protein [Aquificales bacterium]
MIKPEIYDVIEVHSPIPENELLAGMQGTLVHQYDDDVFEVEFINSRGETIALCTLSRDQFIVVWQAANYEAVPLAEQVAQYVILLPQQAGTEVLDFARFLSYRQSKPNQAMSLG